MGRNIQHAVSLTEGERAKLEMMSKDNQLSARISKRVHILLALDDKDDLRMSYEKIASVLNTSKTTICAVAKDYSLHGLDYTVSYHYTPASLRKPKVNGELEANVIQLACGSAPGGRVRWTLELLTEEANKRGVAQPVSRETVRLLLKNNELRPHQSAYWCIPPKENAEFVACMEDILHIYALPYDPGTPVICMDEKPYQLLGEVRDPLTARPGDIEKLDSEYKRCGTCSIFVFTEALAGSRHVSVREQRTKKDWAEEIEFLLTELYPGTGKVILVMDNLNTHTKSSLYQTFPAAKAAALANRLEIHYTPKHGSWLDMAEIEIGIMSRQALARPQPDIESFKGQIHIWKVKRNAECKKIDWQFKTSDARIKLAKLYPVIV